MIGPLTLPEVAFLAILVATAALLITERLRTDVVALLIILALAATRLLSPDQALSGFGSEPAVTIAAVFVLGAGLRQTGVSETIGLWIGRVGGGSRARMLAVIMPAAAVLSAFTHHVAITAVLLPVTLTLAERAKVPPSKLLMPLAVGSSLGTTITTITPSFLVGSALLEQAGQPPLSLFSVAPIGVVLTLMGTLYMLTIGRLLLPTRQGSVDPTSRYRLDTYLTELRVLPDSPFVGHTLAEVQRDTSHGFDVVGSARGHRRLRVPFRQHQLREGDVLLVRTTPDELVAGREETGLELEPLARYSDGPTEELKEDAAAALVQAVVAPRSSIIGRTLAGVDFRRRYGALVVGLWRRGGTPPDLLSNTVLREGDVLVVQGDQDALARLADDRDFLLLLPFQGETRRPRRALIAAAIMVATIGLITTGWLSLGVAMLAGAVAMVLLRCVTIRQAYAAVDAPLYLFVAGAIPLGAAMKSSGTADLLAGWVGQLVGGWQEVLILLAIFAVVAVVVQFMGSDSATTALFGPMVIALGQGLKQAPEPYLVTVAIAAITATLTPMAHHNLVIYRPGGYRFTDYFVVGAPLTLLIGVITALMAPHLW